MVTEERRPAVRAGHREDEGPEGEAGGHHDAEDRDDASPVRFRRRVVHPCLAGDPEEARRHPEREAKRKPQPHVGEGAKEGEQRGRREYRCQHERSGTTRPQHPRGERSGREDGDEVGAGVEPDEGLVDALVVEHEREKGHREPVREARDRERDGGDDELSPARDRRVGGERLRHRGGRERGNRCSDYA